MTDERAERFAWKYGDAEIVELDEDEPEKKLFDPSKHPREPAGSSEGGEFAETGGEGEGAERDPERRTALAKRLTGNSIIGEAREVKANSRKVDEVARELNARAGEILQSAVGRASITEPGARTDDFLADAIAADLKDGLHNGHSLPDWYSTKMKEAMSIAEEMHPELAKDADKRFAYITALAITSQGEVVDSSARLTEAAYETFNKTGKFPTDLPVADPGITGNFVKMNKLIDRFGVKGTKEIFDTEMSAKELAAATGYKVGKTGVEDKVYGSAVLGPKIGQGFYQNLNGNFKPLTLDMWFMRSWGRMTNTGIGHTDMGPQVERLRAALKDEGRAAPKEPEKLLPIAQKITEDHERNYSKNRDKFKSGEMKKGELIHAAERFVYNYAGAMVEAPKGANHRRWITNVFHKALDKLAAQGVHMTPAEAQATWWNPEKAIYERLGVRVREVDTDYAQALGRIRDARRKAA